MIKMESHLRITKKQALVLCILVYISAGAAAIGSYFPFSSLHPILIAGIANIAATIIVFLFSVSLDNSSMYDPYWSLAPIGIGFFYFSLYPDGSPAAIRKILVISLLLIWGVRLTLNWAFQWRGIAHEDWRYVNMRKNYEKTYWLVSFFGIHFFPTAMIFFGSIPLFTILSRSGNPLGYADFIGAALMAGAIILEFTADRQLHHFLRGNQGKKSICRNGIWNYSRHPNYLGEILFWWGIFFFGFSAGFSWLMLSGPVLITLLFVGISIPMMEKHLMVSRNQYKFYQEDTSVLIPFPKKKNPR